MWNLVLHFAHQEFEHLDSCLECWDWVVPGRDLGENVDIFFEAGKADLEGFF